jgi:predicted protein tyrosine phosphatase
MDEVIPGLFIGPKESAELSSLQQAGITAVVSVGCPSPEESTRTLTPSHTHSSHTHTHTHTLHTHDSVQYLSFPTILDTPESIILHIFAKTTAFIASQLEKKSPHSHTHSHTHSHSVLVHCVYGQSRSAAVIVAFLLSKGYKVSEALIMLKSKHSNICVNPGFISQVCMCTLIID